MSSRVQCLLLIVLTAVSFTPPAYAQLIFDDPLTDGTTIGVRDNGQGVFVIGEGWKVTSYADNIRYTPATPVEDGVVEFDVKGLRPSDDLNPDGQLMSMYDASWGNPRFDYVGGLRLNPFKFVWHRYGDDGQQYHENEFKVIMKCDDVLQFEDYSALGPYPWNESATYHMKVRWKDGIVRFFLNGLETDRWPWHYKGIYRPGIHDIRIGTNTRNNAIIDAVYSNVKIYDYGTVPIAPHVANPRQDVPSSTVSPIVDWVGERHDRYEVHVTTGNEPESGVVYDSGQVNSELNYDAVAAALGNGSSYFAHVRLRNDKGWGPWSEPRAFSIDTGATPAVDRYAEYEIVLLADTDDANPYLDVTLSATFTGPSESITVDGFWDGGRLYKVRMLPTQAGTWTWVTSSNRASLNGVSGSFTCQSSTNKGYVWVSPSRPYTYAWAGDGSPFLLLGDTMWHMWYNLRFADGTFQSIIDARAAQHFNYIHGVVHDSPHNEGGNIYSVQDPVTEDFDCDRLNPGYFQWLDRKIDYMNAKGMVASLFFSWGNEGYQEYDSGEQYKRYARYLVARFAAKNVFWIIVGEFEEAGEPDSQWIEYMNEVRNHDPYDHPISMHTVQTTDRFGSQPAHSFISHQRKGTPEELRALIANSRVYNKPVVNLEYGYEGDPGTFPANQPADDVRKDHYGLVLAGGYGVYGNNWPGYSTYHATSDFVPTATDTPGAEYMKILYEFFESTSFHMLDPSQHLVNTGICAAWPNHEYIVQLVAGGGVNVNLSGASGTFYVDWFNPMAGTRQPLGTVEGGATRSFVAPDGNDWILHIHDYELNPGAPVAVIEAAPTSGPPPLQVSFDASNSFDPEGQPIQSYAWDFDDDGTVDSTEVTGSYTYTAVGTYTPRLTVTDVEQKTGTASVAINVSVPGVSIDLGVVNTGSGLTHYSEGDGDTVADTIVGRECRRNVDPNQDHYFMFGVDDGYAFEGSDPEQYVSIEYCDTGSGSLELQYDSIGGEFADRYKSGGSVALTGTGNWKTHTFHLTDAYFGNRQNSGADFRVRGGPDITFYLDVIRVSDVPLQWTPVAVIDASVTSGPPPLAVSFDGSGSHDEDGEIVGYAWDYDDDGEIDCSGVACGHTYEAGDYTARLTVTDNDGLTDSATVTIEVAVVVVDSDLDLDGDVDMDDYGLLQACYSGEGGLVQPGCEFADIDADFDVDQDDYGELRACMNGAGNPPGC